jgi:hypothetical protein
MTLGSIHGGTILGSITLTITAAGQALAAVTRVARDRRSMTSTTATRVQMHGSKTSGCPEPE